MSEQIATGNPVSDKELVSQLLSKHKQTEVKKSGFPTETIDLPSKGLLYPEGHPLSNGTIEMKYMTAREEDILTTQSLIKRGTVFDELFKSLIVTPFDYGDLYVGDKNAVMIAARVLGYGKDYVIEMTDPFASAEDGEEVKQKVTVDLSKLPDKEVNWDVFRKGVNRFSFTLPVSGRVIEFQLLTQRMEEEISAEVKARKQISKREQVDHEFTIRLKKMIVSVDGNESKEFINNFVDNDFFARDSFEFRNYFQSISPTIETKFVFTSDSTGESKEVDIPMDVSFFWPSARV